MFGRKGMVGLSQVYAEYIEGEREEGRRECHTAKRL